MNRKVSSWMMIKRCALAVMMTVSAVGGSQAAHAVEAKTTAKVQADGALININTATAEQLTQLSGIGPKKAEAIIAFRSKHPFKRTQEIVKVKGVGPKMFEKIKASITVGEPASGSTATH